MSIPQFHKFMLPVLQILGDEKIRTMPEIKKEVISKMGLTSENLAEMIPSGRKTRFDDRVEWAKTYLKKAGLVELPERGNVRITEAGKNTLKENLSDITLAYLEQYEGFSEFRTGTNHEQKQHNEIIDSEPHSTPEEALEYGYQEMRIKLADEILNTVKTCSPRFFEQLVIELLVKMGYGGNLKDAGSVLGQSGDGGVDGIIKEDKLGLDVIYVQAKRWDSTVGRPVVQAFVGALHGKRAKKGIMITTGTFSAEAKDYVQNIDSKIVLIDGRELTELMIDNNLGVSTISTFEIKRIDSDYFVEQ
jgi:restriction system protein